MKYTMYDEGRHILKIVKAQYDEDKEKVYLLLEAECGCYFPIRVFLTFKDSGMVNLKAVCYLISILRSAYNDKEIYELDTDKISDLVGRCFCADVEQKLMQTDNSEIIRSSLHNFTPAEWSGV